MVLSLKFKGPTPQWSFHCIVDRWTRLVVQLLLQACGVSQSENPCSHEFPRIISIHNDINHQFTISWKFTLKDTTPTPTPATASTTATTPILLLYYSVRYYLYYVYYDDYCVECYECDYCSCFYPPTTGSPQGNIITIRGGGVTKDCNPQILLLYTCIYTLSFQTFCEEVFGPQKPTQKMFWAVIWKARDI